jgi:hypothetical protein
MKPLASKDQAVVGQHTADLNDLVKNLEQVCREQSLVMQIAERINAGVLLEDVLENIYADFRELIPYDRIGLALLDDDGQTVVSVWNQSDLPGTKLKAGYRAPLAGSSLAAILQTGQPRIINDLAEYLVTRPSSVSTQAVLAEGVRSSLTCPLIAAGKPLGFIFFSSAQPYTYANAHIDLFQKIAGRLAVAVERGKLVSELARQKAAIEQQNQELLRLNELKNTFVGMAAHDLRSPLAYVYSVLALLADSSRPLTPAEQESFCQDALQQIEHMLRLIDDLLDVTLIEAGKLSLELAEFDLQTFLNETVAHQTRTAQLKGSLIQLEALPAVAITGDQRRLRQVVDNLVSNALKYSPPGATVSVGARLLPQKVEVYVQDEGPGITAADRLRLFQDFARLSARPTGGEKSTGLGLAISRRVVEAHGGEIGVDSGPGKGARFWFTLPERGPAGQ